MNKLEIIEYCFSFVAEVIYYRLNMGFYTGTLKNFVDQLDSFPDHGIKNNLFKFYRYGKYPGIFVPMMLIALMAHQNIVSGMVEIYIFFVVTIFFAFIAGTFCWIFASGSLINRIKWYMKKRPELKKELKVLLVKIDPRNEDYE